MTRGLENKAHRFAQFAEEQKKEKNQNFLIRLCSDSNCGFIFLSANFFSFFSWCSAIYITCSISFWCIHQWKLLISPLHRDSVTHHAPLFQVSLPYHKFPIFPYWIWTKRFNLPFSGKTYLISGFILQNRLVSEDSKLTFYGTNLLLLFNWAYEKEEALVIWWVF